MLEVVGQYTQLKKAGANYMGRCPFHEEKTPSFSVDPAEKLYYCFGCGEGGDLLTFVEKKENLDFAQAVEALADRFGVQLDYEEIDRAGRRRPQAPRAPAQGARAGLRLLRARAVGAAQAAVAQAARAYLTARGLGDDVCRQYRLGFSLPGWANLRDAAVKKGFNERELTDAGLVVPGKKGGVYDRFRGRLMFPLADERGRVLGFGARTLGDDKPKYLNSPETLLYHKSEALFGLDKAKAERRQARPPVRRRGLHRRHRPGAGRGDQRGRLHGHGLHRGAAQAPHAPHAQPVPVLRRRRRRPGRHEPRPRARPAPGRDHARGARARRSRPRRLRARRQRRRGVSAALPPKPRLCYSSRFTPCLLLTTFRPWTVACGRSPCCEESSRRQPAPSSVTKRSGTSPTGCS